MSKLIKSKSKQRERKPARQPRPKSRQRKSFQPNQKTWIRRFFDHPIILLLGFLASVFGIGGALVLGYDLWEKTTPRVEMLDSSFASPFLLDFSIKNDSLLFDLRNIKWDCIIDHISYGTLRFDGNDLGESPSPDIEPGGMRVFECSIKPVRDMFGNADDSRQHGQIYLHVTVKYNTLLRHGTYESDEFVWNGSRVEGEWTKWNKDNIQVMPYRYPEKWGRLMMKKLEGLTKQKK